MEFCVTARNSDSGGETLVPSVRKFRNDQTPLGCRIDRWRGQASEAGELRGRQDPGAGGWLGSEATRLGESQVHPGHHHAAPEEGTLANCVCILFTEILCGALSPFQ